MAQQAPLEQTLAEVFVDKAPKMPEEGKKFLVQWAPIISLVAGVVTLLSAWTIWHWAHAANSVIDYANSVCATYHLDTCNAISASRFDVWVWLSLIFLAVEGVLYLAAYPGLRDRKKAGWNLVYYGALVNVAYAVISLFTDYDKVGHFILALLGSAIGFWVLFQIRSGYTSSAPVTPTKNNTPPTPPATPEQ